MRYVIMNLSTRLFLDANEEEHLELILLDWNQAVTIHNNHLDNLEQYEIRSVSWDKLGE